MVFEKVSDLPQFSTRSVIMDGEEQLLRIRCDQLQRAVSEGWSLVQQSTGEDLKGRAGVIHSFMAFIHSLKENIFGYLCTRQGARV